MEAIPLSETSAAACAKALKGLSHEIFGPVFWPVCMRLGLNRNRYWFLTFKYAPSFLIIYFKFGRVSGQSLSEILGISEKDLQYCPRLSKFHVFWKAFLQETRLRV